MTNYDLLPFEEVRQRFIPEITALINAQEHDEAIALSWSFLQRARGELGPLNPHGGMAHYYLGGQYNARGDGRQGYLHTYSAVVVLYECHKALGGWEKYVGLARAQLEMNFPFTPEGEHVHTVIERARTGFAHSQARWAEASKLNVDDPAQAPHIIELVEEGLMHFPACAHSLMLLGGANLTLGKVRLGDGAAAQPFLTAADAAFTAALQLDPYDKACRANRGMLHMLLGNLEDAIDDFSVAIRVDPDFGMAYFFRARCHEQTGKKNEALADWRQAERLVTNPEQLEIVREHLAEF